MQLGMIGLGRMGSNMVTRLMKAGHQCVVYDSHPPALEALVGKGATGAGSLDEFVKKLQPPRVIWLMVPAAVVDPLLHTLAPLLERGDTVVDGGNSYYQDDLRRAAELEKQGVHHVDVGVSGGVWGLERGYCQMIGGEEDIVQHLDPIFKALAPGAAGVPPTAGATGERGTPSVPTTAENGYLRCGPNGAGHFVKMVHNGIEYGLMAAYAEGLNILRHASIGGAPREADAETAPLRHPEFYQYNIDLAQVTEVWRHASVIGSWLLDLTAAALAENPDLSHFEGRVSDSGEGRWTLQAAVDEGVPAPVISSALFTRFSSRGGDEFADKVMSAMRFEFGGHVEKAPSPPQTG